jgi:hypothetical protein
MIAQILMVFAFVFAVIAAVFITTVSRPPVSLHFGWLAISFWILALLLGGFGVR